VMKQVCGGVWTEVKGFAAEMGITLDVREFDFPDGFDFGDAAKPGEDVDGLLFFEQKKAKVTLVVRPSISVASAKEFIERIYNLALGQICPA
jgi:hypothetical protein